MTIFTGLNSVFFTLSRTLARFPAALTIAAALPMTAVPIEAETRSLQPQVIPCYKLVHHGPYRQSVAASILVRHAFEQRAPAMNNEQGGANEGSDQMIATAPQVFPEQTAQGATVKFYEEAPFASVMTSAPE